jgi:hypothetical protein
MVSKRYFMFMAALFTTAKGGSKLSLVFVCFI